MTALAGRVALVTGASRGIGAAVAEAFGAAGATVVRIARSLEDGRHDGHLDIRADLTDAAQVATMAERVRAQSGPPDIVVHNVGGFLLRRLADTTPAEFDQQVRVNLRAAFLVARELLPAMAARGRGTYVSVGSVADQLNDRGKSLRNSQVLVVGVTYKKNVPDLRESPALKVIDRLLRKGALVEYHDPFVPELRNGGSGPMRSIPLTEETLATADCVVVLTDHSEIPWAIVADHSPLVLDTRNALRSHRGENIIRL